MISCTLNTALGRTGEKRASRRNLSSHERLHIPFFPGTECRGQKREGLRAGLQLPPCPKNTQLLSRLNSGDTVVMASVGRSVCGRLRSEDLLHTGVIVALLLGEFVSSSPRHCSLAHWFPTLLSVCPFQPFRPSSFLFFSILLSFYEWFQHCTAITVNLHFFESGSGPDPSSVLFSIVIRRRDVTTHEF